MGNRLLQKMNTNRRKVVWIIFWLTSILTLVVYSKLWMMASYHFILNIFGIASACLGIWLIVASRFAWRSILLVTIGLVIGQWWLIEQVVVHSLWKFSGAAP